MSPSPHLIKQCLYVTELFLFPSKCWLLNFTFWTCRLLAYNCNRTVSFLLWVGYALILVQHHKQTFLEPLYKIQKLSRIDFYWLFYFPTIATVQEWTKSYIELIALYALTKNSSQGDHIQETVDYSRLGLENKFFENKSGRIFAFDKFTCQQIWGRVNQPFILFIHHIWGETIPWGAVFIIQTSDRMQ